MTTYMRVKPRIFDLAYERKVVRVSHRTMEFPFIPLRMRRIPIITKELNPRYNIMVHENFKMQFTSEYILM